MAAICVFCSASEGIHPAYVQLAADLGAALARRGHSLVSGGGSVSCMGAVARAARAGGAHTVGVIPEALHHVEVSDHDSHELLVVADMRVRKALMDERADAFITLPGGLGTLEELTEVWTSRFLGMHLKPVVAVDHDDHWGPLRAQVDRLVERGFLRAEAAATLQWADSVEQALDLVEAGLAAPPTVEPSPAEVLEAEPPA